MRLSNSLNPFDLVLGASKTGNLQQMLEVLENCEKDGNDEDILNGVEENKWGPLHYACLADYPDIVKLLVTKKINCNKVSIDE